MTWPEAIHVLRSCRSSREVGLNRGFPSVTPGYSPWPLRGQECLVQPTAQPEPLALTMH